MNGVSAEQMMSDVENEGNTCLHLAVQNGNYEVSR